MLKCKIKRNGYIRVKTTGTARDLTAETAVLIHEVYQNINQQNPEAASGYQLNLIGMLLDPGSHVWKVDGHGY